MVSPLCGRVLRGPAQCVGLQWILWAQDDLAQALHPKPLQEVSSQYPHSAYTEKADPAISAVSFLS